MRGVLFLSVFAPLVTLGCASSEEPRGGESDVVFQVSTLDALLEGVYQGEMTFEELRSHGDFGLGTFDALDGEMVKVNGQAYQVKTDGIACTSSKQVGQNGSL